jgi:membrane peptidoglycan carboxypeptidase
MPNITQVIRLRQKRRDRKLKYPLTKISLSIAIIISLAFLLVILLFSLFYAELTLGLPSITTLPTLLDPPHGTLLQPTRIYDRTGMHVLSVLENPSVGQPQYMQLPTLFGGPSSQTDSKNIIPPAIILTMVATHEPDFWVSRGYTWSGLLSNQHPTIAQQLVSDLLLWQEPPGLQRAIRERLVAAQITATYGSSKILTWYLNSAKYGDLIFGVDAASHAYFGKSTSQLTLAESAILAATSQVPSINPFTAPDLARQRGKELLSALSSSNLVSPSEYENAAKEFVQFQTPNQENEDIAQSFVNLAIDQLSQQFERDRIERGGLRIITTLDYDLQVQANCVIKDQINRMNVQAGETDSIDDQCQAARLLPTLKGSSIILPSIIRTQVLILDPTNGELLALSSIDSRKDPITHFEKFLNSADNPYAPHRTGTIITPFIYLTGFTRGYSPASMLWDIPPANQSLNPDIVKNYHGPVRARIALANDYLVPAGQILDQVGLENVNKITSPMGIQLQDGSSGDTQESDVALTQLLSGTEANLIQLSQIFGMLSNNGTMVGATDIASQLSEPDSLIRPVVVLLMEDYSGHVWAGDPSLTGGEGRVSRSVISPQLAYLMTNSLSDESARWSSFGHPNALEIGRPAGVKVGSTVEATDFWTIGYTPQLVVGVWIGYPEEKPPQGLGKESIMGIWHSLIQYTTQDLPIKEWSPPPGVVQMEVCDPSGMLPDKECPSIVSETFLVGNSPTQTDNLYERLQVNRETGRLATIFTPAEFSESRVYMRVPPQAIEWAKSANIPLPPDSYDVIQTSGASATPNARIDQPVMLSYVHGKVDISGTAFGPGFSSYRLRVGKGLNPTDWLQIGSEGSQPVENGILAQWDTTDLSGLYSIQLIVIHQDQSIETSIVQVTVDNVAPEIVQIIPADGQTLDVPSNGLLTIGLNVSDDIGIDRVEIYLDGSLVTTLQQKPYAFPWQAKAGQHNLLVKVYDLAGNNSSRESNFIMTQK